MKNLIRAIRTVRELNPLAKLLLQDSMHWTEECGESLLPFKSVTGVRATDIK